jgi:protein ImuB
MKSLTLPLAPTHPTKRQTDTRPSTLRAVQPSTAPAPARTARRRRAIWLALHFPDWPLRAALSALNDAERSALEVQPLAVVDADRRSTVLACNKAAASLGIRAGHSINAAIALSANMQFLPRHPTREVELLSDVAELCERYTSAVSLQPPNELVLEVRGSVRLFGGITAFVERIRSDFKQRGFDPQVAMSSTVHSSLWLSRIAEAPKIVEPRDLIRSIARLPVSILLWPADLQLRLARFGVLTIGDLLRLPRGGLARRIGYERLAELDRAVGRHPEVRQYFAAADHYEDPVTLDFEIETTGLLSVILEKRLRRLQMFLTRRNLAVDGIRIQLRHREQVVTPVMLGLASPTADMHHVSQLMREQLGRVQLPSPVIAFAITVQRLHPACEATHELFSSAGSTDATLVRTDAQARLLEQLRSRLGDSAVTRVQTVADYRPECAHVALSATVQPTTNRKDLPTTLAPRPLWLLSEPRDVRPTALRTMRPEEMVGPEKIETGWWDDQFAVRDYYRLTSSRGALGWVYRDHLRSGQWRLHGLFG